MQKIVLPGIRFVHGDRPFPELSIVALAMAENAKPTLAHFVATLREG
jgi:hypothetical protein